jgi:hypothetical protein
VTSALTPEDIVSTRRSFEEAGRQIAGVVLTWRETCHRKVEAIELLQGVRARRKISTDCTPPHIPWPPRPSAHGDGTRPSPRPPAGQAVVPLTFIAKAPMRGLDVVDDAGRSLPVLGRHDNGMLATAALEAVVAAETSRPVGDETWLSLHKIAFGAPDDALELANELIKANDLQLLAETFIRDIAANFLLCVLLPQASCELRQVIKYSYHWETGDLLTSSRAADGEHSRSRWWSLLQSGLGFRPYAIELSLRSPSTAASYHLEVPAPEGLVCTLVALPSGTGGNPLDATVTALGHVYDSYEGDPDEDAQVELELSGHGLHPVVTASAVGTFVLFALALSLPDAMPTLLESSGGANGLFLFGPALLLALLASRRENALVSAILLPLRLVALGLSGLLFTAGASLVGKLRHPWITALWWSSAVLSGAFAMLLVFATIRLRRRGA